LSKKGCRANLRACKGKAVACTADLLKRGGNRRERGKQRTRKGVGTDERKRRTSDAIAAILKVTHQGG